MLAPHRRTVASRANFNTEIGLPLEILAAPAGTEVLVLEMAMRGAGQIAELAEIAEPDVGVIVTIGPVHLELLGTIEAIAAAKAELLAGLAPGAVAVVPANEPLLAPHLRSDLRTVTFGDGGDVRLVADGAERVEIDAAGEAVALELSFTQAHLRRNLLAAVAAAQAVGVHPSGRVMLELSAGRGQATSLPGPITLIDDSYNANPVSMRASLDELAATARRLGARPVAVLGDMLELGPQEWEFHVAVGVYAREQRGGGARGRGPAGLGAGRWLRGTDAAGSRRRRGGDAGAEDRGARRRGARQGVTRRRARARVPSTGGARRGRSGPGSASDRDLRASVGQQAAELAQRARGDLLHVGER